MTGGEHRPLPTRSAPATKPTKAIVGLVASILLGFLGAIVTARQTGAHWDADLFLAALYTSLVTGGFTGGGVYVVTNRNKVRDDL